MFVGPTRTARELDAPSAEPASHAQVLPSPPVSIRLPEPTASHATAVLPIPAGESDLDRGTSWAATDRIANQPVRESYGTAVDFLSRPAEAARQALHEQKLLFLLHVSGNFEDAKFT
jgi:hypothetical protein